MVSPWEVFPMEVGPQLESLLALHSSNKTIDTAKIGEMSALVCIFDS